MSRNRLIKKSNIPAGSDQKSGPEFLIVGRVSRSHGVRGSQILSVNTDFPEHLHDVKEFFIGSEFQKFDLESIKDHPKGMLIKLKGIDDRDTADLLRQELVYIHINDAVPLEDGEYYLFQLEGMTVYTDKGDLLGQFSGYLETGANDVYIIDTPEGSEILLPAIPDVILNVDVQSKKMTVHLLEGLL